MIKIDLFFFYFSYITKNRGRMDVVLRTTVLTALWKYDTLMSACVLCRVHPPLSKFQLVDVVATLTQLENDQLVSRHVSPKTHRFINPPDKYNNTKLCNQIMAFDDPPELRQHEKKRLDNSLAKELKFIEDQRDIFLCMRAFKYHVPTAMIVHKTKWSTAYCHAVLFELTNKGLIEPRCRHLLWKVVPTI